jgi:hypothetical protein
MPRKIGIDLDGVLADFDGVFYPAAWQQGLLLGRMYYHQKRHDFHESFPGEVTNEQIMQVLLTPGFYRRMETLPCLIKMARGFAEKGWEIHLVTARPNYPHVWDDTAAWLYEHRLPYHQLSFQPTYHKHVYAEEHGLNLFVEDRLETANALAPICTSFLVANDHNVPDAYGNPPLHAQVLRRHPEFYARLWNIQSPELFAVA